MTGPGTGAGLRGDAIRIASDERQYILVLFVSAPDGGGWSWLSPASAPRSTGWRPQDKSVFSLMSDTALLRFLINETTAA